MLSRLPFEPLASSSAHARHLSVRQVHYSPRLPAVVLYWQRQSVEQPMMKTNHETGTSRVRLILIALILLLGAYWVGARYGPRQSKEVEARRSGAGQPALNLKNASERSESLTEEESINVRIYRQASPAVANVLTKATEYDFFMDPVPVEGAGSGFLIDPRGYILTNFHVVAGAPTSAMMSRSSKLSPKGSTSPL